MAISRYILSTEADRDLEGIFDYTAESFSVDQAVKYLNELDETFSSIVSNPEIGRKRDEIKEGVRSLVKSSHIIFYHIGHDHIRVIRVLHGSRDLPKFFD